MPVNVVFGKPGEPAKFYHRGNRISVDAAFRMYRNNARFVVGGKTLNVNRFGAREPTIIERNDIHEAARQGGPKLVAKLVDSGVDVNRLDADGMTPVWLAAMKGHHRVVGVLADKGANLDVLVDNFKGLSPLMIAAMNGHHKAVRVLVDKGANIDLQSDHPALLYVDPESVGYVVEQTALMVAAEFGHLGVVRVLIEMGANLDLVDWDGGSALMAAAEFGNLGVVRVLIEMGANLELVDTAGNTALLLATDEGHLEIVRLLVAKGANLDHTDTYGVTPVFSAAANDHPEMVRLLVAKGANLDLADEDMGTPLGVATENGHQGVIDVINAFERHRIARIKRSVRSLTRQDPSKVKVPKEMDGVIGSFLIS